MLKELFKLKLAWDTAVNEIQLKIWNTSLKGLKNVNKVIIEQRGCFAVMKEWQSYMIKAVMVACAVSCVYGICAVSCVYGVC